MKKIVWAFALAALPQASFAALKADIIEQVTQKLVNKIIAGDSFVNSLNASFDLSQTNLEKNIAMTQVYGQVKTLPWAKTEKTLLSATSSYHAVYEPAHYGVEAATTITIKTQVLEALRYGSTEALKEMTGVTEPHELEFKALLQQMEKAPDMKEIRRIFGEMNKVSSKILDEQIADKKAIIAKEKSGTTSGMCYTQATQSGQYSYAEWKLCMDNLSDELNSYEMAKVVQSLSPIEAMGDQGTRIILKDAGGVLDSFADKGDIKKVESKKALLYFMPDSIMVTVSGFVGARKYDLDDAEAHFKSALLKHQMEDPDQMKMVEADMRSALIAIKKAMRVSP